MSALNLINFTSTCRAADRRKQKQKTAGPEHKFTCSLEASSNTLLCSTALTFSLLFWLIAVFNMILLQRKAASWGDLQLCIQNWYTKVSVTSTSQKNPFGLPAHFTSPSWACHHSAIFGVPTRCWQHWVSCLSRRICALDDASDSWWNFSGKRFPPRLANRAVKWPTSEKNATYHAAKGEKSGLSEGKA